MEIKTTRSLVAKSDKWTIDVMETPKGAGSTKPYTMIAIPNGNALHAAWSFHDTRDDAVASAKSLAGELDIPILAVYQ